MRSTKSIALRTLLAASLSGAAVLGLACAASSNPLKSTYSAHHFEDGDLGIQQCRLTGCAVLGYRYPDTEIGRQAEHETLQGFADLALERPKPHHAAALLTTYSAYRFANGEMGIEQCGLLGCTVLGYHHPDTQAGRGEERAQLEWFADH